MKTDYQLNNGMLENGDNEQIINFSTDFEFIKSLYEKCKNDFKTIIYNDKIEYVKDVYEIEEYLIDVNLNLTDISSEIYDIKGDMKYIQYVLERINEYE